MGFEVGRKYLAKIYRENVKEERDISEDGIIKGFLKKNDGRSLSGEDVEKEFVKYLYKL